MQYIVSWLLATVIFAVPQSGLYFGSKFPVSVSINVLGSRMDVRMQLAGQFTFFRAENIQYRSVVHSEHEELIIDPSALQKALDSTMQLATMRNLVSSLASDGVRVIYYPQGRDGFASQPSIWVSATESTGRKVLSVESFLD